MPTACRVAEDQHDCDSGDVPHQDCLREVVCDPAKTGEAGQKEHEPHHDREHRCERGVLGAPTGGERGDRRCDQKRDGALRSDDDPRRGPQGRVRQNGQQESVQPGADRTPGQLGVGHGRRQGQCRDRDAGNDIGPQPRSRVRRHRTGEGHVPGRHRWSTRRGEGAATFVGLAEWLHGYTQPGRTTSGIARWDETGGRDSVRARVPYRDEALASSQVLRRHVATGIHEMPGQVPSGFRCSRRASRRLLL